MKFAQPLQQARLLRRYKRFLADVEFPSGEHATVHCPNPGSMKTCIEEGAMVWLSQSPNPKRKLPFTLEWIELSTGRAFVNPVRANDVVFGAIKEGTVPELKGYDLLEREVRFGEASRFDGRLRGPGTCWVEVKNVTLALESRTGFEGLATAFPDSKTARGLKHLRELERAVRQGERAVLFFCASRENAESVSPADSIDPAYGEQLRVAAEAGVELIAYRVRMTPTLVELTQRVPVLL